MPKRCNTDHQHAPEVEAAVRRAQAHLDEVTASAKLPDPRLRIVSDGTPGNTRIEVDGKLLPGVKSVTWRCDATGPFATATLRMAHVEVDVWGRSLGTWKAPAWALKRGARSRLSSTAWHLRAALKALIGRKP